MVEPLHRIVLARCAVQAMLLTYQFPDPRTVTLCRLSWGARVAIFAAAE